MEKQIKNTITQLKQGKTILYPTDTVWGIGCDVFSETAVKRIYEIKQREDSKALIVLVSDIKMLQEYVVVDDEILKLIKSGKPTTIIYADCKNLPKHILASDGSVAVRLVNDQFCKKLINTFGKPIVSTSANISKSVTPQIYSEINETILHDVDYVVNWRQEDESSISPSKIIKILNNGKHQIIRE